MYIMYNVYYVYYVRTMFGMPDNCLIFYRHSLDFFVVFQDRLQY